MSSNKWFDKTYGGMLAKLWAQPEELHLVLLQPSDYTFENCDDSWHEKQMLEMASMLNIPRETIITLDMDYEIHLEPGWQLQSALEGIMSQFGEYAEHEPQLCMLCVPPENPQYHVFFKLKCSSTLFLRGTPTEIEVFRWLDSERFTLPELPTVANFRGLSDPVLEQEVGDVLTKVHEGDLLERALWTKASDIVKRGWK
jgi:hypothetical protein